MPIPSNISDAPPLLESLFQQYRILALIPTYNNAPYLESLLKDTLYYTRQILVVNDGSTDSTAEILAGFPQIRVLDLGENQGKGMALRKGFQEAWSLGYERVITMDSDGQHLPSDLIVFLDALKTNPHALFMGSRNLHQEYVPSRSQWGNRFSNFWFYVNTGYRLPDTQTGYRLYPLAPLVNKKFRGRRFEFEVEVLVRAAWAGVPILALPIKVHYPPAQERISHFRPWQDFGRISLWNTVMVLVSLFWVHPRRWWLSLWRPGGWKRFRDQLLVQPQESNLRKSLSLGFGVFMGIVPIWGFQMAVGIPLAIGLRLNKALFLLAINISIFPPIFWFASLWLGRRLLRLPPWSISWRDLQLEQVKQEGLAFLLGGAVLALVSGLLVFLLSYGLLQIYRPWGGRRGDSQKNQPSPSNGHRVPESGESAQTPRH